MSFIRMMTDAEATGRAREFFDEELRRDGVVWNLTRALAWRPEVVDAWRALNGSIRSGMDLRRFELVTLAAAQEMRASYCALAHGKVLREKFFEAEPMLAIARDGSDPSLSPVDVALMQFARKVARDAADVTAGDIEGLRALGLTDPEILDAALAAAARAFFSKVLDALGVLPDAAYGRLDPDLRAALTVGRPIATETVR